MLAMAIFIEKYKKNAPIEVKDKVEAAWLKKWKGVLGNPIRQPCHVIKACLYLLDTTVDEVDDQMCWECWPEDEGQDEFDDSL
jgi:hypothetical protein